VDVEMTGARVNHRPVQRITYTFADGTGTPRFGSAGTTDGALIGRARAGQPLAIEYDPQAPGLTRLAGGSASFFGWFVLFPLGFAVVGAVILGGGLRRLLRARALYVHGEAVRAQVTAVSPTATRVNRRPVMRVEYSFDTITGRVTGEGSSMAPPPVGATIWVVFDRSAPRNNLIA
jgi:hypothetical protein